jgi:hypothetical protein
MTLGQAAVRFRTIETEWPPPWGPPRTTGGPEEGERLCRDVMTRAGDWVAAHLPAAGAQVTARLEAELEQLRGPDGTVHLPDESPIAQRPKRPMGSLPPSKPLTGPAPPRRSACAPAATAA